MAGCFVSWYRRGTVSVINWLALTPGLTCHVIDASGIAHGNINELAERLGNDEFELVAVGRALLQDPEWVIKVREGRFDELSDYSKKSLMELK